ncbi:4416_t:CDS:1 [Racocetra fulgida]|uniref:4416_t:CDS:1 n=1 Tax=Racocetra fulgida TaxID=60492 RepID=A0A9N9CZG9_9GLOM|nr:4416_t:CDS:1 [Racocetra fulgida]
MSIGFVSIGISKRSQLPGLFFCPSLIFVLSLEDCRLLELKDCRLLELKDLCELSLCSLAEQVVSSIVIVIWQLFSFVLSSLHLSAYIVMEHSIMSNVPTIKVAAESNHQIFGKIRYNRLLKKITAVISKQTNEYRVSDNTVEEPSFLARYCLANQSNSVINNEILVINNPGKVVSGLFARIKATIAHEREVIASNI